MKKITKLFLCFIYVGFMGLISSHAQTRNTLEFDATNVTSLADCGISADYSPANFTAEAWVNLYTGGGTIMSNVQYVNSPGEGAKGFSIRLNGETAEFVMGIGVDSGDWVILTANETFPLNIWTHVAVVYDGAKSEIFYNGISKGSVVNTNPILVSSLNFYLGEHPTWSGRRMSGQLSDVRIWNVARTAGEIQSSMNSFLTGNETGLVANWKLNEGIGAIINDQVSSTTGTIGAGTTWQLNSSLDVENLTFRNVFNVYPNPSKDVFKIESSINETVSYKVYTITGKLVKSGSLLKTFNSIDLSDESKGLYILKGTLEGKHFIKRLMVN